KHNRNAQQDRTQPDHCELPFGGLGDSGGAGFWFVPGFSARARDILTKWKNAIPKPASVSPIVKPGIVPSPKSNSKPKIVNAAISDPMTIRPNGTLRPGDGGSTGILFSRSGFGTKAYCGEALGKVNGHLVKKFTSLEKRAKPFAIGVLALPK